MTDGNAVQTASIARPPQASLAGTKDAARTRSRLGWLDVLRGLAALCVVFNHFGFFVPPRLQAAVYQWINPGDYGVFVFFIISGYIVPASLERNGSVRAFWVSRIFRLYPLYLLAIGLGVLLWTIHFGGLRGEDSDPETSVFSQLWHSHAMGMSAAAELTWERCWFWAVTLAGLTFGAGLAFRHVRWPRILTWPGLISYSVYLLHPQLIEVYRHLSWTGRHYSFWPQLLVDAVFLVILIAMCSLTYLLVERPMQNAGRRLARWLDASFGSDRAPGWAPAAAEPVPAHHGRTVAG